MLCGTPSPWGMFVPILHVGSRMRPVPLGLVLLVSRSVGRRATISGRSASVNLASGFSGSFPILPVAGPEGRMPTIAAPPGDTNSAGQPAALSPLPGSSRRTTGAAGASRTSRRPRKSELLAMAA